jgi:hypothetical protein
MATKKPMVGGASQRGVKKTSKTKATGVKKPAAPDLTARELALLKAIRGAPEPERYDIVMSADRKLVKSLIDKDLIRVRTIKRPAVRGTIPLTKLRAAIVAVRREREAAKPNADG